MVVNLATGRVRREILDVEAEHDPHPDPAGNSEQALDPSTRHTTVGMALTHVEHPDESALPGVRERLVAAYDWMLGRTAGSSGEAEAEDAARALRHSIRVAALHQVVRPGETLDIGRTEEVISVARAMAREAGQDPAVLLPWVRALRNAAVHNGVPVSSAAKTTDIADQQGCGPGR
jgi:hypothetical protein